MAAVPAAAGGPFAKADEVKRLQAQVDQLSGKLEQITERLDFISPIMPMVNFVQDFIQRVECEASVQLMRLKNAQVKGEPSENNIENATLETAKWLHFMTDAVMLMHNGASPNQPTRSSPRVGSIEPSSPGLNSAFPSLSTHGEADVGSGAGRSGGQVRLTAEIVDRDRRGSLGERRIGGGARYDSEGQQQTSSQTIDRAMLAARDRALPLARRESNEQPSVSRDNLSGPLVGGSPLLGGTPILGAIARNSAPGGYRLPAESAVAQEEPLAEPGTGSASERAAADGLAMTGSGGLIMGRGSWATAYRQASGNRREALRLLCTSGIVTARELADDLTVISEEHIEECVLIATEMLQTWTLEMWARQPQEAKKFFEARLTALYQRKFGEQKG